MVSFNEFRVVLDDRHKGWSPSLLSVFDLHIPVPISFINVGTRIINESLQVSQLMQLWRHNG